jgi:hypothetical protein
MIDKRAATGGQSFAVTAKQIPETAANSIKCEIGLATRDFRALHLSEQYSKIKVTVASSTAASSATGAVLSSIIANLFKFGGPVVAARTDTDTVAISYNFNSAQLPNCNKRNRIPSPGIGVEGSVAKLNGPIVEQAQRADGTGEQLTCAHELSLKEAFRASGGVPVYIFVPSGAIDIFHTGTFKSKLQCRPRKSDNELEAHGRDVTVTRKSQNHEPSWHTQLVAGRQRGPSY